MSSASDFVGEASGWARELVRAECRGPGDYLVAMRRVASRARVPFGLLWNLHYRIPKSLHVEKYAALGAFFYADQQARRYAKQRETITPRTALGAALLRATDRMVGEDVEAVSDRTAKEAIGKDGR